MHKRRLAQIGLVQIESILFHLAVKGHQSFLVLPGFAALVPAVGSKVKHIPAVHSPDVGTFRPHFQHMFVVYGLIRFAPVALFRLTVLVCGVRIGAIL